MNVNLLSGSRRIVFVALLGFSGVAFGEGHSHGDVKKPDMSMHANAVTPYSRILWDWATAPVRNMYNGLAERDFEKIAKGAAGLGAYGVCAWCCYSMTNGWPVSLADEAVRVAREQEEQGRPAADEAEPIRRVLTRDEEQRVERALGINPDIAQRRRQVAGWMPETDDQRQARYAVIAARGYIATLDEIRWQVAMNDQQDFEWRAPEREQGRRQNQRWMQRELLRARRPVTIDLYGAEFAGRLRREARRQHSQVRIAMRAQARRPIRVAGRFNYSNGCMRHEADGHRGFQDVGHVGNIMLSCGHVMCSSCVHTMIRKDSLPMEEIANLVCDVCDVPFAYDLCDNANAEIIFGQNQEQRNAYNNLVARLQEVDANPQHARCPECNVGVDVANHDVPQEIVCQTEACQVRGFRFCTGCSEHVHEGPCAQYRADLEVRLGEEALHRYSHHEGDMRRSEQFERRATAEQEEILRDHAQRRAEWAQRVENRANAR